MEIENKVLFVDDDKRYADPLIERAYTEHKIILQYCEDWEEGKSLLEANPKEFKAIIIDGKGKLKQGEKGDDSNHLNTAISDLKHLKSKGIVIPYVINTAYFEEFSKYFKGELMIDKKDTDKLFFEIKKLIASSEVEKIKFIYSDVFEVFSKNYLDQNTEEQLIKVIKDIDKKELADIKGNLTNIRSMHEAIYNALRGDSIGIVPKTLHKFNDANKHLDGNLDVKFNPTTKVYQNNSISSLSKTLYWVSGQYIHNIDKQKYFISNYTVKSLLFNLMELLLWFKGICKEHYK